jgi:hypothetical protein
LLFFHKIIQEKYVYWIWLENFQLNYEYKEVTKYIKVPIVNVTFEDGSCFDDSRFTTTESYKDYEWVLLNEKLN